MILKYKFYSNVTLLFQKSVCFLIVWKNPSAFGSLLKPIKFTFLHLSLLPLLDTLCRIHRGSPLNEKEYIYYLCGAVVYVCRYMCGITSVWRSEDTFQELVGALFPFCGSQGLNSGLQFWWQVLLLAVPYHQPHVFLYQTCPAHS